MLPPIGIVIGIYIAWVGADAPGGKFQGGAVLAAMWAGYWISKGFAAQQEALLVAARLPEVPSDYPGSIENVTEPVSGLSLQMREFYNPTLGTRNRSYILLFGCGRGSTASLVRLV